MAQLSHFTNIYDSAPPPFDHYSRSTFTFYNLFGKSYFPFYLMLRLNVIALHTESCAQHSFQASMQQRPPHINDYLSKNRRNERSKYS